MRTAEETFNEESWKALGAISPSKSFCLKAMKKHAKYFIEWSAKKGWESYVDEDRWICISQSNEVIDTEELYKRFEEDINKKP